MFGRKALYFTLDVIIPQGVPSACLEIVILFLWWLDLRGAKSLVPPKIGKIANSSNSFFDISSE